MRIQPLLILLLFIFTRSSAQYRLDHVDTFSINHTLFRIRFLKTYTAFPLLIEKYNKKWIIIDSFTARSKYYEFKDLNNDGYVDLFADNRWQQLAYLFNPKRNTFIKCGYFSSEDYDSLHVISKKYNLYCDKWSSKWGTWWSYLYVIINYKRYNLGIIEYKYLIDFGKDVKEQPTKKHISVRKIFNDTDQKVILDIKKADFENFDIKKFWQEKKSKFYPNALMKPNYNYTKIYEPENW